MITSIQNRATIGKLVALGFLLATLMATLLSAPSAGAAMTSGKAYSWGDNSSGQLGNGSTSTSSNIPGVVRNLTGVMSVKAGCSYGLALKTDGTVYAWGDNDYGQLGDGTNHDRDLPVKAKIENVKAISAGCTHSLALKEDGTVYAWGGNGSGQLGNGASGNAADRNVPMRVDSLGTGAKGVAAGSYFSLALMKDGTVRAWGDNIVGQLGDGTSGTGTNKTTPVAVKNLFDVRAIATDGYALHALALLEDGTVRAWGDNYYGQLGDGTSGNIRSTPVGVSNLTDVKKIAGGGYHSLALLGSGKVKSWGDNHRSQLGDDTTGNIRTMPVAVIKLTNVRSISAGAYHSLAILESGRARSWGSNSYGELGDGTSGNGADRDVPVAVEKLSNVKNIDGGLYFTLAATR
jgi:alpha-tubulin suppressor-like RCC1 family protein